MQRLEEEKRRTFYFQVTFEEERRDSKTKKEVSMAETVCWESGRRGEAVGTSKDHLR